MPGSEKQNSMFKKTVRGYRQENHPFTVTSCGRRRNNGSPIFQTNKRTKGEGRHFRTKEEGAGMTKAGVESYKKQNPGSKAAKRRKSFCARSKGWTRERGKAARRRWKC